MHHDIKTPLLRMHKLEKRIIDLIVVNTTGNILQNSVYFFVFFVNFSCSS
jgi:hypothetical protein